jgi:hypothetical protein
MVQLSALMSSNASSSIMAWHRSHSIAILSALTVSGTAQPYPITQLIRLCDREDRIFSQNIHSVEHLPPGEVRQRANQLLDVQGLLFLQHGEHRDLNGRARRMSSDFPGLFRLSLTRKMIAHLNASHTRPAAARAAHVAGAPDLLKRIACSKISVAPIRLLF